MSSLNNHTLYYFIPHYTLSLEHQRLYIWLKFSVTCSQLKYECNPYTFLNFQNKENIPVKQSNRSSVFTSMNARAPYNHVQQSMKVQGMSIWPQSN